MFRKVKIRLASKRMALKVSKDCSDYFSRSRGERIKRNLAVIANSSEYKKPLIVLTSPRTGSTLFCNLMRQIDGCFNTTEVLSEHVFPQRKKIESTAEVVEHIHTICAAPNTRIGVAKIFYENLSYLNLSARELDNALSEPLWVHLWRKDLLAQFVSYKIAESSSTEWHTPKDVSVPHRHKVHVSRAEYLEYRGSNICSVLTQKKDLTSFGKRVASVSYEEFTENPLEIFENRICPLVESSTPCSLDMVLRKQTPVDYRLVVSNPEEIDRLRSDSLHLNTSME